MIMMKYLFLFCMTLAAGAAVVDTSESLVAAAPGAAFVQGEKLKFSLKCVESPPRTWTLRNWRDEVVRQGTWPGKELVLAPLPNGYYKLELIGGGGFTGSRGFAVVSDPGKRPANPDMFFALDSAQSWLARPDAENPRQPGNAFEIVSEVARRSGAGMVRDRMSWAEVNPARNRYVWTYYKTNAELLKERGIRLSGMYHDSPGWCRNGKGLLPTNLLDTYVFAKNAAEAFRGCMANWEFWNEQDHGFGQESAWDYAAALKAASLGFKAGEPEATVAIGGFAITPVLPYADVVMKNGAGCYFDIFNIHTYRPLRDFPEILTDIRAHMERCGIAGRPIWFTENGSGMEGAGREESFMPGIRQHSFDQELLIAEYLPKMMISMQMLGVSRDFFFVLPPYSENGGNKDWGLMRRDYTVKPGFAAFATLVDQLGDAVPEGEADVGDGVKGYLYRHRNGSRTLVYWSISELDTEPVRPGLSAADPKLRRIVLPPQEGPLCGTDLFGTPFEMKEEALTVSRFPSFLHGVTGLTVIDRAILPPVARDPEAGEDRTVVFRTELSEDFLLSSGKDYVDIRQPEARFKLEIWNLSGKPKKGTITVSGGDCTGIPPSVSVPPFGKAELALRFSPTYDGAFKTVLAVGGVFNGRRVTPLVVPVQGLQAMAGSGRKLEITAMLDPVNWRKNASGEMQIAYDEMEEAIRFHTVFPAIEDRWSYPEYELQLPQESLKGALGIALEAKVSSPAAVRQMLVMAVPGEGERDLYLRVAPDGEWEKLTVQFPAGFEPDRIRRLRIGVNSAAGEITVWLRKIRFVYAP